MKGVLTVGSRSFAGRDELVDCRLVAVWLVDEFPKSSKFVKNPVASNPTTLHPLK